MRKSPKTVLLMSALTLLATACSNSGTGLPAASTGGMADCSGESIKSVQTAVTLVYMPANIAENEGYFENLGLDVEMLSSGVSTESLSAVAAGSADVAVLSLSQTMLARDRGAPVKVISMVTSPIAVQLVIKRAIAEKLGLTESSSGDERARALKGLTIGMTNVGSASERVPRFMLESVGLDPDKDAKMIPIGDASAAVAAFVKGQIDVLSYSSPVSNQAMKEGDGVSLANIAAGDVPALSNYNSVVTVANERDIEDHPTKYVCYLAGLQHAMDDIATEGYEAAGAKAYASYGKLDRELFDAGLKDTAPSFSESIVVSEDHVKRARDFLESFGDKVSDETVESIVAPDLIELGLQMAKDSK